MKQLLYLIIILMFLFVKDRPGEQGNSNNDFASANINYKINYKPADYPNLPAITFDVPRSTPRMVITPLETLIVNPNILVYPSSVMTQTETPIVSSRNFPNLMFGSSNTTNMILTNRNSGVYVSTDGGNTWSGRDTINNGNAENQAGDPAPVIDKNGNFVFVHMTTDANFGFVTGIGAENSTNFGQSFSPTFQIVTESADKCMAGTDDYPFSPYYGNIYAAWNTRIANSGGLWASRFAKTRNGGISWQPAITINAVNTVTERLYLLGHDVAAAPNGNVFVAWARDSVTLEEKFIGVAKSADGGESFTVNEKAYPVYGRITSIFNGWQIRRYLFPKIAIDKSGGSRHGWIYIATNESPHPPGTDEDIILHRSTDDGQTWSPSIRVNQDPLNNGKVQFFPSINVDADGGVNVIYYDNRNFPSVGDSCSVFISRSLDGGNTWTDVEIADHHFKPKRIANFNYMGDYIGLTSGNGKLWGLWADDKTGIYNAWAGSITYAAQVQHDIVAGPFLNVPQFIAINHPYDITARFTNNGSSNETNIPIKFYVNNVLTDSTAINLNTGQMDSVTSVLQTSTEDSYDLMYISSLPDDGNRINDTIRTRVKIRALPPHDISTGPFLSVAPYFVVGNSYNIKVRTQNVGLLDESNIPVKFFVNNTLVSTTNINLNFGQVDSVNNLWIPPAVGLFNLMYISDLFTDSNKINDTTRLNINVLQTLPELCESFSDSLFFPPLNWNVVYTNVSRWSRHSVSSFCLGSGSARFNYFISTPGVSQQLYTTIFKPTSANIDSLIFYNAYATYSNHVDTLKILASSDEGVSWSLVTVLEGGQNGPLVTAPPTNFTFIPTCEQWKRQSVQLPPGTNKLQFNAVSGQGNCLYLDSICVKETLIGIEPVSSEIPKVYSLSQNYPNPFNPVANIIFGLPKAGKVKLVVYDITGRLITVLVDELRPAGYHKVLFDGANLASGVYFYKIEAGDFSLARKMVLLK